MNTIAEKYAKMVEDTDATVSFYMEMEGGRFFLMFLAEALMELLEAEEVTSVPLLLKKFFEAAGSDTPECLRCGGDNISCWVSSFFIAE